MIHVLTIRQPWASLILLGIKQYETRGWSTRYRGRLYIHAGRFDDMGWYRIQETTPDTIYDLALRHSIHLPADFPTRSIIGSVDLAAIQPTTDVLRDIDHREKSLGDYTPGRFAWLLKSRRWCTPTKASGRLGIWSHPDIIDTQPAELPW